MYRIHIDRQDWNERVEHVHVFNNKYAVKYLGRLRGFSRNEIPWAQSEQILYGLISPVGAPFGFTVVVWYVCLYSYFITKYVVFRVCYRCCVRTHLQAIGYTYLPEHWCNDIFVFKQSCSKEPCERNSDSHAANRNSEACAASWLSWVSRGEPGGRSDAHLALRDHHIR